MKTRKMIMFTGFLQVTFPIYLSLLYHKSFFVQLFFMKNIFCEFNDISYGKKQPFDFLQAQKRETPFYKVPQTYGYYSNSIRHDYSARPPTISETYS